MGRCYDSAGRLCCDKCDEPGQVRARRCPSGYCPSADLCPKCWGEVRASGKWASWHKNCPARHAEYVAAQDRERAILATGAFVRRAAMGRDSNVVQVVFRDRDGRELWRFMNARTYDAIPLLETATPADYARHGALFEAPAGFHAPMPDTFTPAPASRPSRRRNRPRFSRCDDDDESRGLGSARDR